MLLSHQPSKSRGVNATKRFIKCMTLVMCLILLLQSTGSLADAIPQPTLSPDAAPYDKEHPENLEADQLYCGSAILIEKNTGKVIFEKDADTIRYPASTTKIMTVLLGIVMVDESLYDQPVVCSERAVDVPEDSSSMGLQAGEIITYRDLLYGTMMMSANDGCNVIAEKVSGSIEAFVQLMNNTAAAMGCTSTHFANTHGYHDDYHYTTARDMAIIAQAAMEIPMFREIVGFKDTYTIEKTNMYKYKRRVTSTNQLYQVGTEEKPNKYYYPYAIGIKTGQHSMAGYCFVGAAEKDGVELISVVLYTGQNARWADTIKLMDYGFSQYTSVTPIDLYNMNPMTINTRNYSLQDSNLGKLTLNCVPQNAAAASKTTIIATFDEVELMAANLSNTVFIEYSRDFEAPIKAGEVIGTMTYYPADQPEVKYNLVASRTVNARENAPKSLEEITTEVMSDPNPFPDISVELVMTYLVIPLVALTLIISAIILLWRKRPQPASKTPKVVWRRIH